MNLRLLYALLLSPFFVEPAVATSWGLNSFSDSVYWSRDIAVCHVTKVDAVKRPEPRELPDGKARADVTVRVVDVLKGSVPQTIRVIDIDLGDAKLQSSPLRPLPKNLVGRKLLLLLTPGEDERERRAYARCLIEADTVHDWAFGLRRNERSLQDVRAMVAQLNLIQAACPRDKYRVKNEDAALAACRTALWSQYDEVVWYGLRRLLDRDIPANLVPDLLSLTKTEEGLFPNGYLVVQCLGKANQKSAVPALIDVLRKTPRTGNDVYTVKALQAITGSEYGTDIQKWEDWWTTHGQAQK